MFPCLSVETPDVGNDWCFAKPVILLGHTIPFLRQRYPCSALIAIEWLQRLELRKPKENDHEAYDNSISRRVRALKHVRICRLQSN
jgi:hypothetical protein